MRFLSIPYLSWCSNRLEEALVAVKSTTDVTPFLQLADSQDLQVLHEAVSYLEKQDISKLKSDWNAFYGVSESKLGRLLKWQTAFPEAAFSQLLSETKALFEKVEVVAEKARLIDSGAVEAMHDTADMHTGFLEFVKLQHSASEKGDLSSLSVAHFFALLKVTDKLHLATMKVVSNKDNELISDEAKKSYLLDVGFALRDARDNQKELLSFLNDIRSAGIPPEAAAGVQNAIQKMKSDIQKIYDDIHQMRMSIVRHAQAGESDSWSVDLTHRDNAILKITEAVGGVARDDQRADFNLLHPEKDKVVVTYDHSQFIDGIGYELRQFRTELEGLEKQFGAQVPAGTQPLDLAKKSIFDVVGDKIPASLETRHKNLHRKPYEMSQTAKEILFRFFAFLQLSEKAVQFDTLYEQMSKAASQAPVAKVKETKKSEQQEPLVPGSESTAPITEIAKKAAAVAVTETLALNDFGNKHRRIVELREHVAGFGMENVEVPMPFGLASSEVKQILKEQLPSLFDRWNTLGSLYATREPGQEGLAFLQRQDVGKMIQEMRQDIMSTFESLAPTPELAEWLKKIDGYLMVRSTGDEDSKYANAGGNISVPYVEPRPEDVMRAAGQVVASYFSIPSLANRLNARANPFDSELKLAVTIQELIGEELGGTATASKVPVSLVLFTNEPNLGGDKNFRIMRIGATYGHGEAVVGNQGIATDTFYLMRSRLDPKKIYWRSAVQEKPQRLAPVVGKDGKPTLAPVDNSKEMQRRPVMDERMLERLFRLGELTEASFGGEPTDMEIVIVGDKIYPVQARPVNRPIAKPHYVDPEKIPEGAVVSELRGKQQVAGTGDALIIRSGDEVLIDNTLGGAESRFQLGKHRIVINREREPEASHYVVNFAGMGVPALQFDDIEPVKKAVSEIGEGRALVIDVQDGSIRIWKEGVAKPEDALSEGYLNFPGHVSISLNLQDLPPTLRGRELPQTLELKELIRNIKLAKTNEKALGVIKELCDHPVIATLGSKVEELEKRIAASDSDSMRARLAVRARTALDARIQGVCQQALHVPQGEVADMNRMEIRQYTAEFEALLFSQPGDSLGAAGVVVLEPLTEQAAAILDYVEEVGSKSRFKDLVVDSGEIRILAVRRQWREMLKILEQAGPELQPKIDMLLELIEALQSTGMAQTWITQVAQKSGATTPEKLVDTLLNGMTSQEFESIKKLGALHTALLRHQREISLLANPASFERAWSRIQEAVGKFEEESVLFDPQSLARSMLLLATFNRAIELVDKSIKSMKASTQYDTEKKIATFREMVTFYLGMTKILFPRFMQKHDKAEIYVANLMQVLENAPMTADTLFSTPGFDVSKAVTSQKMPKSLEDLFMTVHQSLLFASSDYGNRAMPANIDFLMPQLFKKAKKCLAGITRRVGLENEVTGDLIVTRYARSLREHGAELTLVYDLMADKTTLHVSFTGSDEGHRWEQIQRRMELLSMSGALRIATPCVLTNAGLSLTLDLNGQDFSQLESTLSEAFEFSMTREIMGHWQVTHEFSDGQPSDAVLAAKFSETALNQAMEAKNPPFVALAAVLQGCIDTDSAEVRKLLAVCLRGPPTAELFAYLGSSNGIKLLDDERVRKEVQTYVQNAVNSGLLGSFMELLVFFQKTIPKGYFIQEAIQAALFSLSPGIEMHNIIRSELDMGGNTLIDMLLAHGVDARKEAVKLLSHGSSTARDIAFKFFKKIASTDPDAVKNAARTCLQNPSEDIQIVGLKLYKIMVIIDNRFFKTDSSDALKTVEKFLTHNTAAVREDAYQFFTEMADIDPETVKNAAFASLHNPSAEAQVVGLKLYKHFASKAQFLEEAHAVAAKGLESKLQDVRAVAHKFYVELAPGITISQQEVQTLLRSATVADLIDIFKSLAKKGQFLKEAHELAATNLQTRNNLDQVIKFYIALADTTAIDDITTEEVESIIQCESPREEILFLFQKLANRGKFPKGAHIASLLFHSSAAVRATALSILEANVNAEPEFVKSQAQLYLSDPSTDIQIIGLKLAKALFEGGRYALKDNEYFSLKVAEKFLFHSSPNIREAAQQLFTRLAYRYPEIVQDAARLCLDNTSTDIQVIGLKLYNVLVSEGQFLEEAHAAAANGLESNHEGIRAEMRSLYVMLAPKIDTITRQEVQLLLRSESGANLMNIIKLLVQNGRFLKEVHEFAAKSFQSQSNQKAALELYSALADTAALDDITLQEVESMMQNFGDLSLQLQKDTLSFFAKLAKRGKFLKEALQIAGQAYRTGYSFSKSNDLGESVFNLYLVLIDVVELSDEDHSNITWVLSRDQSFELYTRLSEAGKSLSQAYLIATDNLGSRRERLALCVNLLKHNFKGFSHEMISYIIKNFFDDYYSKYAPAAFIKLIESNLYNNELSLIFEDMLRAYSEFNFEPAFKELFAVASTTTQHSAMRLLQKAAQKGLGLEGSRAIAEKQITSQDPTMRAIALEIVEKIK